MRKLYSILFFLLLHFFALSNDEQQKDSLYKELEKVSSDHKPKLLFQIAEIHFFLNEFSKTKAQIKNSLKLAREKNQIEVQILALSLLANTFRCEGDLNEALRIIIIASKIDPLNYKGAEIEKNFIFYDILTDMHAHQIALKYLEKNRDLCDKNTSDKEWFNIMTTLGMCYTELKKWKKAEICLKKALIYNKSILKKLKASSPLKKDLSQPYNNLGCFYAFWNKKDLALYYFKSAQYVINKSKANYELSLSNIQRNIGIILAKNGDFKNALTYFTKDFKSIQKLGNLEQKNACMLTQTEEYYIPIGQWNQAEKLLKTVQLHINKNENNQLKVLKLFSDLYLKKGELQLSTQYLNRYITYKDSIDSKQRFTHNNFITKVAQLKIEKVNNKLNIQQLTYKNEQNKYIGIISFSVIISLFLTYLIVKKFKDQKRKLELNILKNELAEAEIKIQQQEIEFKNKEMEQFALNIIEKNEFLENIKKEIKQANLDPNISNKLKEISSTINHNLSSDLNNEEFDLKLDQIQQSFFLKLQAKHPDLTENEKKLCSLLYLKLSSKEIAEILTITIAGVHKNRQRLRKKLGIDSQVDIVEWFETELKDSIS